MDKITILVSVSPYQVVLVKNLISEFPNIQLLENCYGNSISCDLHYHIMGFPHFLLKNRHFWLKSKPLIVAHWIGSDVLSLSSERPRARIGQLAVKFAIKTNPAKIFNLAVSPWLVDELKSYGYNASYSPISSIDPKKLGYNAEDGQKSIDFISYLPLKRFSFYGGNEFVKLSQLLPQFNFVALIPDVIDRKALPKFKNSNLRLYPKISFTETQKMLRMSKCLIRLTEHDGLALSVLEALYHKLQVIWSYSFPYVIQSPAHNLPYLYKEAVTLIDNYKPNNLGNEFVLKNFSNEVCKQHFKILLKRIGLI